MARQTPVRQSLGIKANPNNFPESHTDKFSESFKLYLPFLCVCLTTSLLLAFPLAKWFKWYTCPYYTTWNHYLMSLFHLLKKMEIKIPLFFSCNYTDIYFQSKCSLKYDGFMHKMLTSKKNFIFFWRTSGSWWKPHHFRRQFFAKNCF